MSVSRPSAIEEMPLRANRFAAITAAPFSLKGVSLRWLRGSERLGQPFTYRVKFIAKDPVRNFGQMPGERMTVGMMLPDRRSVRYFNGIVTACEYLGIEDTRRLNYEIELQPWIALLGLRRNSRIFHEKTSLEVIRIIFGEHGGNFRVKVRGSLPKRTVCTQYEETDLAFVSRLMEQDGLYYFFEHTASEHVLVLADDPADHEPCKPEIVPTQLNLRRFRYKDDMIWQWFEKASLTSGRVELKDYDHEKPKAKLSGLEPVPPASMGDVRGTTTRMTEGGAGSQFAAKTAAKTAPRNTKTREVFSFPGHFTTPKDGEFYARRQAEAIASKAYRVRVEGSMRQVVVGCRFRAENPYDQPDMSKVTSPTHNWLAVAADFEITGEVGEGSGTEDPNDESVFIYRATIEAQAASTAFRPDRVTPWPCITGPQTAEVDGPRGSNIATDKLGRLRVRFHWDREGGDPASGWIRVAQSWAGKGFGGLVTPRVGQEVVVQFHNGNPDWPLITGAVYNTTNMPADTLPKEATRSSFRSQSVPGRNSTYNEFRIEDAAGNEEVLLRAERDYNLKVGDTHRSNIEKRYVMTTGPALSPTGALFEVTRDSIRLMTRGPTGPQGVEISPAGVFIIGNMVGLMSRTSPVIATPAIVPIPQPTPPLTRALASMMAPPVDTKVKE